MKGNFKSLQCKNINTILLAPFSFLFGIYFCTFKIANNHFTLKVIVHFHWYCNCYFFPLKKSNYVSGRTGSQLSLNIILDRSTQNSKDFCVFYNY